MGNVDIRSASPLDDAVLDLEVDLGEITVNGDEKGRDYHQDGSSGIRLAITADLGDIKVNW